MLAIGSKESQIDVVWLLLNHVEVPEQLPVWFVFWPHPCEIEFIAHVPIVDDFVALRIVGE